MYDGGTLFELCSKLVDVDRTRALPSSQQIPRIIQPVELQTNVRGLKKKQEGAGFEVFDASPPHPAEKN